MQSLVAYEEMEGPDDNPGNNGPIQPTGGGPAHGPRNRKHAVGVLRRASSKSRVLLRTLADLRLKVPPGAKPGRAKICVYKGKGQNPHPLGEDFMTLQVNNGRVRQFIIDPSSAPRVARHIRAGNTLGIEISAPLSLVPIVVSSRLRNPARVKTNKARSKKPKKAARSRR